MRKFLFGMVATIFSLGLLSAPVLAAVDNTPDYDSVAIIRGGVFSESAVQTKAKQGDVPKVYAAFGIQQRELNGFVNGVVWKDGRVTVGSNKVVAKNAVTAGRWDNPKAGMTKIAGTDRAYKMPTRYFSDEGQTAFIKMVNGRFSFAIIKPCGNPVTATPVITDKPGLSVEKQVALRDSNDWKETVTVQRGEQAKFRIIAKNTGNTVLDKLSVQDVLPQGLTQVVTASGSILNGGTFTNDIGKGIALPPLKPGQSHTIIFGVTTDRVGVTDATCRTGLVNKAIIRSGDVVPDKSDTAAVKVCETKAAPAYACSSLTSEIISREQRQVRFTATHTLSGDAQFVRYEYDLGDGSQQMATTKNVIEHTYIKDGAYTARVSVVVMANGSEKKVSADNCSIQVAFDTPVAPTAPAKLVDTGPGALIGAIMSVMAGGTAAYKLVWLRRFGL